MMVKFLQNLIVGVLISFFASIPFGYLNLIGISFFDKSHFDSVFYYLFGVILIELCFIYLTLIFSENLTRNKKLQFVIDQFSFIFMFLIAIVLFLQLFQGESNLTPSYFIIYNSPFLTGLILSGLNFIQIPFWMGWNIYLLKNGYIEFNQKKIIFYLIGTSIGTFFGMFIFILLFNKIIEVSNQFLLLSIKIAIPLFYLFLGTKQGIKNYVKPFSND